MMIIFRHLKSVIYEHAVSPKSNVNDECYFPSLKLLRQHISRKHLKFLGNCTLHHDYTHPHSFTSVENVNKGDIKIMLHPPCSLALAPYNFSLFPMLKEKLRGRNKYTF